MRRLVFIATALTFLVVALGAFVRLSDAGLGCPDWPGCYGHYLGMPETDEEHARARAIFPTSELDMPKAWKEMIHRYFAGALGLMILAITILSWRLNRERLLSTSVLIVVIFQAALGMWTVTLLLKPVIVTLHLLGGMSTLALLLALYWRLRPTPFFSANQQNGLAQNKTWLTLTLILLFTQIALGGWVSSNYAALACMGFPACNGSYWPAATPDDWQHAFTLWRQLGQTAEGEWLSSASLTVIHWVHRLGAVVVSAVVIVLVLRLWSSARGAALLIAGLLMLQIALGVANVLLAIPLKIAVAHNLNAAFLLSVLLVLWLSARQPSMTQ